jgi:hypothetical protein
MSMSRRKFIGLTGAAAATSAFASGVIAQESYSDVMVADSWMSQWMRSMGAVSGTLHVGRFADPMYYLLTQINWEPNRGESGSPVTVPKGFVTDFASIPRVFWSLLPRDGAYTYPAIIHDFLYWDQSTEREEADNIFRYAMQDFEVGRVAIATIFRAVRVGGQSAWRSNTEKRAQGERRILREIPSDPRVSWAEWKARDVFR